MLKRRSKEERNALRALLKVMPAFSSAEVKVKVFLRDDILDAISSDGAEPIAGLSHVTAKAGAKLGWSSDSLCVMITKRLASNWWIRSQFAIDTNHLDDVTYARSVFQRIMNFKFRGQNAFDWITSLISDGKGVVTPRDLIDLMEKAFQKHSAWLQQHPTDQTFMSPDSIKAAHRELSEDRFVTILKTEFAHLMPMIERLQNNRDSFKKDEVAQILGDHHAEVGKLVGVGILRFDPKKSVYRVARLFGPGLGVFEMRTKRGQ